MDKHFFKKNMKELIIGGSIIIATIIFVSFNDNYSSSKDHCYKKVYKDYIKKGNSEARAAMRARRMCK